MFNDTALEIMRLVEIELGLSPSGSVQSQTPQARAIVAYMNAVLDEVVEFGQWSGLEKEATIEIGSPVTLSATTVANDATVTVASTASISSAFAVTGENLQNGSRVLSVTNGTTFELDRAATASGVVSLSFARDTFDLPSDLRFWIPQTQWDTRNQWQLIGPTTAQFDAWQRNGIVGPYPRRQFRRTGPRPTAFRIFPPPFNAGGDYPGTLTYLYVSGLPVLQASDDTYKRRFTEDTDTTVIPDTLIKLGAKWKWREAKGFDFGPSQQEYYNWFDGLCVADQGEMVVDATGGFGDENWLDRFHVPDGNYPGSSTP